MQPCFCIKGVPGFDFYLKVLDTKTLIYNDLTSWVTDEPYTIPDTYDVEITLPDSNVRTLSLNTQKSTVIKAEDAGISKFKDGIYSFFIAPLSDTSGGCGYSYTKISGVFPNLECCIDNAYSKLNDDKFLDIREVDSWLQRAKISSSLGKEKQSLNEWMIAKKLLQKLNCECSC